MAQTGKIGVTAENIFPVIKKFLYSDHEIFLRELVANAVDATQKMKALAGCGDFKGELGDLTVRVALDPENKTLTITDRGIGMTAEEVDKYINQIAFSSAGEFLEKYKDQLGSIIGHFGLGFYSSFMVSKKVVINTLSWREGAQAVRWECDGDPEYTLTEGTHSQRGTEITLYLDDDAMEFAEEARIKTLLNKYCKFMPIPIAYGKAGAEDKDTRIINATDPIWTKKPTDLTEEDYLNFYRELYPMQDEPLFHIHLNVDYPFNLTGVLYFPKIKEQMEIQRNKIQLFCNQVFVTDSVENIVPEFLTLLHGVIDSPDIPLNVSRSYLQSDSNVKKISTYITKKVADRLEEIFKNDRSNFESKWDNLKLFIEFGMLSDEKFCERAEKFALLKNTEGKFFSYEDYRKAIETEQTDKNKKVVYLYATDVEEQYAYIETAKNKGYDVLLFDCQLDSHFVGLLEQRIPDSTFARVDADVIDKLICKEDLNRPEFTAEETTDLSSMFESALPTGNHYYVTAENLGETGQPILITQSEFMRRYREMSAMGGGMNFYGEMPASYNIAINVENPLIQRILKAQKEATGSKAEAFSQEAHTLHTALDAIMEANKDKKAEDISTSDRDEQERIEKELDRVREARKALMVEFANSNELLHQVTDLALLANNMLKGKSLNEFIKRSISLL
ncbi:MAG: molecular chaperone HtpG [Bacteroidales bacterium]|nr:molecular chaperone HtpG [Bacteroidales bacterium]